MNTKIKVLVAIIAILAVFAAGRYSVQSITKTEIVQIDEKKKEDIKEDTHTVIVKNPDGTTTTTIDSHVDTSRTDTTKTTDKIVQQTNTRKTLNVSLLSSYNLVSPATLDFGLSISKEVLGPVTVGLWGMKSGIVGVSVGLNF